MFFFGLRARLGEKLLREKRLLIKGTGERERRGKIGGQRVASRAGQGSRVGSPARRRSKNGQSQLAPPRLRAKCAESNPTRKREFSPKREIADSHHRPRPHCNDSTGKSNIELINRYFRNKFVILYSFILEI